MSHRRIRSGNAMGGYLAPDLDFGCSKAVVAGDQVFLTGCTGLTLDGKGFVGDGDPAAQAEAAMGSVRILLEEAGARMEDICLINNYTTRHADRAQVYPVIARCLQGVNPVSTGLIVEALADPCIDFEIDAWAVIPREREKGHERYRLTNARGGYLMPTLNFGNAKVIRANDHLFLQGQTGMSLDGRGFDGEGDPARQAEVAMQNVRALLADAGAAIDDVCKITTYLTDLSHRAVIEPVLARHLRDVRPVITSVVVKGLARPELNFEIDVHAILSKDGGHERFGVAGPPDLAWSQSRACRAGEFVFLQGQSGMKLDGSGLAGPGDAAAQADQAMCNVKVLLEEAGAGMQDICKITTYLTDRESRGAVYPVLGRHLNSVHPTSTGVVVKALANPDLNVVIDVFAAVTGASSPSVGR